MWIGTLPLVLIMPKEAVTPERRAMTMRRFN
jgi:hypothetical protein